MEPKESPKEAKNTLKGAQEDTKKPVFTTPQQVSPPTVVVEKAIVNTSTHDNSAPDNSINNISNWSLFPDEAGVRAVNNRSGDVFIGSISEFNNKIR
jgi:hypothetical protein